MSTTLSPSHPPLSGHCSGRHNRSLAPRLPLARWRGGLPGVPAPGSRSVACSSFCTHKQCLPARRSAACQRGAARLAGCGGHARRRAAAPLLRGGQALLKIMGERPHTPRWGALRGRKVAMLALQPPNPAAASACGGGRPVGEFRPPPPPRRRRARLQPQTPRGFRLRRAAPARPLPPGAPWSQGNTPGADGERRTSARLGGQGGPRGLGAARP